MKVITNVKGIAKPVMSAATKIVNKLPKASPKATVGAGLVFMTAGAIYACFKAPKAADILKTAKEELSNAEKESENRIELGKKQFKIVMKTGFETTKVFAGPIAVYVGGVALVMGGCNMFGKKIAALGTALVAAQNDCTDILNRVEERYGSEEAAVIRHGTTQETVERKVVDKETGKEKTVKSIVQKNPVWDDYAFIFDEHTAWKVWTNNPVTNMMHLQSSMLLCNDKLRKRGYLYLNEALEIFGIETKTAVGHDHGWIYDDRTTLKGDHSVDHGVCIDPRINTSKYISFEGQRDFLDGIEPNVVLRFNCDGNIASEVERLKLY